MTTETATTARPSDEIDILTLLGDVWRQKFLVAACILVGLICASIYLHRATYTYSAELKVTPAQPTSAGPGSRLGGLAGLASMAGIGLAQDAGSSSFMLYTEGLKSRTVAETLARRPDIMRVIFETEWNPQENRFQGPPDGPSFRSGLKAILGVPSYPWRAPDAARLHEFIKENVEIVQTADSPVTTIKFSHEDPRFAKTFLAALHQAVDADLRRKARARSGDYIEYLSRQLQAVSVAEHRVAIAAALSEQEKTRMMASSTLAFAAEPFDPATSSLRPTSPQPVAVLAIGLAVGAFFGILAAIGRSFLAPLLRSRLRT